MADTLFFYASKLIWTLIKPDTWLVLGVLATAIALWRKRFTRARRFGLWTAGYVAVLTTLPLGGWLLAPVERLYAPQPVPAAVDGILILGGFEDLVAQEVFGQAAVNGASERLFEGLALARQFPEAQVVLTGGSGDPRRPQGDGAALALSLAMSLGFERDRFIVEGRSRNTFENAKYTLELVAIPDSETWLLVTSAYHMPRSLAIFCAQGAGVTPYPVDYRSASTQRWPTWDLTKGLDEFGTATRMWTGIIAYRVTGRTQSLLPQSCDGA